MKSQDIRKKFQDYFVKQGHTWVPSSSLIPQGDSSLLFTNAGMNQFKDCFLGIKEPPAPQVCSIQKCLRAGGKHNDLEEVGNSPYHHTFFEMIGSFSFGSYFKKEAIDYAVNFLTKELGLPKEKLWVSVFKEDKESAEIWIKKQRIPLGKIFFLGEKDNFWRMGNTGPCGPCSEIYYYDGNKQKPTPEDMTEIWNLVFMEFNEDHSGRKTPLPKPCIDTGMGLERLAAILQGKNNNYHTDLFKGIIKALEETSGIKYDCTQNLLTEKQMAFRVIADHSRAISFLICDGVLPGSEGASYVLRRILRRALFYSQKLQANKNLLGVAVQQLVNLMKDVYPVLEQEKKLMESTIEEEASLFTESLKAGKAIFFQKIKNLTDKKIPDLMVWDLYSTYGFPPDLTCLIAKEKGFNFNEDFNTEEFKQEQKQKEDYQDQWFRLKIFLIDIAQKCKTKETPFTGYEKDKEESNILAIPYIEDSLLPSELFDNPEERETIGVKNLDLVFRLSLEKEETGWIILNSTCFYPEGGGPIGDKGTIKTETGEAQVLDCKKQGGLIFHLVKVSNGKIQLNQSCTIEVDSDHRKLIATSHSATHLLHHALREVLGKSVRQMGSLVKPGKLRFDFSYPKPLNPDQLKTIEDKVTEYIQNNRTVTSDIYPYEEAKKTALFLAGENYGKEVRVIEMGNSREFCGGIHVEKTSKIGKFKIISETGVQSGVRRITAYTSDLSQKYFTLLETQIQTLREYFGKANIPLTQIENTNPFIHYLQEKEKEIKKLKQKIKNALLAKNPDKKTTTKEQITPYLKTTPKNITQNTYVRQNEELRKYLKLPLFTTSEEKYIEKKNSEKKDLEEVANIFIPSIQKREEEIKKLKKQMKSMTSSTSLKDLIEKTKTFSHKNIKGELLTVILSIEDRKVLAEMADQLKSKMKNPAIVIVLGQGEIQYPLVITVSKELQAHFSAGDILKNTIAPFLEGKGGGQARFAQGTIKNKDRFSDLETFLLDSLFKEN